MSVKIKSVNPDLEWQRRYDQNDTPWDKGVAAPALVKYLHGGKISGRVLVPGCGRGHEVRTLGTQEHTTVVGLDISATAIAQAKELAARSSPELEIGFVEGDFFHLPAKFNRSFDWLVEHTCFCAIEPQQRPGLRSRCFIRPAIRRKDLLAFSLSIPTPSMGLLSPFPQWNFSNYLILTLVCWRNGCPRIVFPVEKTGNWSGLCRSAEAGRSCCPLCP